MHVHPEIAALRSDPALQRRVRDRIETPIRDWLAEPQIAEIARELERLAGAQSLADCAHVSQLMNDLESAASFVGGWMSCVLGALQDEPLSEVPHRYRCVNGLASMEIMRKGSVSLNLVAYERLNVSTDAHPQTTAFPDRDVHEIVLAGRANGLVINRHEAGERGQQLVQSQTELRKGVRMSTIGRHSARRVLSVQKSLVLLQLVIIPEQPLPTLEVALSDGTQIRETSGDKAASQRLMALAVLGAMNSPATLAVCRDRALDQTEDVNVRWEAIRQALASEPGEGFHLLQAIASDGDDALAEPARQLMAQLMAQHPQLAQLLVKQRRVA